MVRLVFRPYTQVKRTICTSVSLRASTRVSPGFTLLRHSSPSFGSQQICSYSNLSQVTIGRWCHPVLTRVSHLSKTSLPSLSFRIRVLTTQILAYMLDSLVRVSRRVDENHLVSISNTISDTPHNKYQRSRPAATLWKRNATQQAAWGRRLAPVLDSFFLNQPHSMTHWI